MSLLPPETDKNPGLLANEGGAVLLIDAAEGSPVVIPGGGWLLSAEIVRQGPDLLLVGADGSKVLIRDYFNFENPPDLMTESGALISADQVFTFIGPLAPGQYAQSAPTPVAEPIGQVVTASGSVEAVRIDGTRVTLSEGDPVYQGDILETAGDGAVSIEFADASNFSLGESGRMVLDEMVYDPGIQEGTFQISVAQGVFSFISGQIAKTSPDAMVLNTPVATIGIRGTTVVGRADSLGNQNTITLLPDDNGNIGEVVISNGVNVLIINVAGGTISVAKIGDPLSDAVVLSKEQIQQVYGNTVLSPLQNSLDQVNIEPDIGNEASAADLVNKILQGEQTNDMVIQLETASGGEDTNTENTDLAALQALADAAAQLLETTDEVIVDDQQPVDTNEGDVVVVEATPPPPPPDPVPVPTSEPGPSSNISGNAIDGYITGATVFADSNNNGVLDVGEASGVTGPTGEFTLTGGTGPLVMSGGVDSATGLTFQGVMRAPAGSTVVTPLTTLLSALVDAGNTPAEAETLVKQSLGLPAGVDITQTDPIAAIISGDPDGSELFAVGAQILNSVILGGSLIAGAGGGDIATTTDAVFAEFAARIISSGGTEDFSNAAAITQIITDAGAASGVDVSATAASTANIIQAISDQIDAALADPAINVTAFLTKITQVSIVAQGDAADALFTAGSTGDPTSAEQNFTGNSLMSAIADKASEVGDVDGPGIDSFNAAPEILIDGEAIGSGGFGGNILFVSDSGVGSAIGEVLEGDGHTVTYAMDDFTSGSNPSLLGDLSGYGAIFWSASGNSHGNTHTDATVFANLTSFVDSGGSVFVTGYDSIASPHDPNLINFLGGTDSEDFGEPYSGALGGTSLTSGVINLEGITPGGFYDDTDTLFPDTGTTTVVSSDSDGASWSLRTLGSGEIAYVSNGKSGISGSTSSWTDTSTGGAGAYNAAIRNFAFNSGSTLLLTTEDTGLRLSDVSVSDTDANGGILTLTVSAVNGTLDLSPGSGLTGITGAGSGTLIVSGTQAAINAALADNIFYDPADDFFGTDNLTISISDRSTVSGYSVTTKTISVGISSVNDAPAAGGDIFTVSEGGTITLSEADLLANASDVDGDNLSFGDGGVTFVTTSTLYVMEEESDSIVKIEADGTRTEAVTQEQIMAVTGETNADMNDRGIAVDSNGNLFFSEIVSDSILMKPVDGGDLVVIVSRADIMAATGASSANPKSLAVGSDGMVYVSDDTSDSVLRIDPAAMTVTQFVSETMFTALPGIDSIDLDGGVVAAPDGMLYVASDGSPDAIFAINTETGVASVLASGDPFNDLDVYMTLAPNGDLIVADDSGSNAIFRIETTGGNKGTVTTFLSESQIETVTGGNVSLEGGIGFDAFGNFYIADEGNDDIYKWSGYDTKSGTLDPSSGQLHVSEAQLENTTGNSNADLEGGMAFVNTSQNIVANEDGSYTFTPPENFNGQIAVQFDVTDGMATRLATSTIVVQSVNDAPVAANDTIITNITDGSVIDIPSFVLTGNDSDVEGDAFSIDSVAIDWSTNSGTATATLDGNGDVQITPPTQFSDSSRSFSYTVSDGQDSSDPATVGVVFDFSQSVYGTASDDTIITGANSDFLSGNGGNDILIGGDGNDTLAGGDGSDTLYGGNGSDVFAYYADTSSGPGAGIRDVIGDFDAGTSSTSVDTFDFLEIIGTTPFNYLGDSSMAFSGGNDNAEARFNDATKILEIDTDGDSNVNIEIELTGVDIANLDQDDFTTVGYGEGAT